MTEEEKKAIEYTENCLMKITMGIDCEFDVNILDALINIIKKLQEENKELKAITNQYEAYECEAPKDSRAKIIIADKLYFNNGYFKNNFIEIDKIKKVFEDLEKIIKAGEENV